MMGMDNSDRLVLGFSVLATGKAYWRIQAERAGQILAIDVPAEGKTVGQAIDEALPQLVQWVEDVIPA